MHGEIPEFVPGKNDPRRKRIFVQISGNNVFDLLKWAYAAVTLNQITTAGSSTIKYYPHNDTNEIFSFSIFTGTISSHTHFMSTMFTSVHSLAI